MDAPEVDNNSKIDKIQQLNIENRNNFLHLLQCAQGKQASLNMYEASPKLSCQVESYEPNLKFIAVSNLKTPIGTEKAAIVRTNDLISVKYIKSNQNV